MSNGSPLDTLWAEKTDQDLFHVLAHRDEYKPEAIEAAEREAARRNLDVQRTSELEATAAVTKVEEASLTKRLALTFAALTVYRLCFYVPLPTVRLDALEMIRAGWPMVGKFSILALGLAPFISGFFAVELFSLTPPWGPRIRTGGLAGRKTLNTWSLRLSLLFCVIQALAVTFALENIPLPDGTPLTAALGVTSRLVTVLTLVAASAAVYALCRMITVGGFGSGFCLVLALDFLFELVAEWSSRPTVADSAFQTDAFLHLLVGVAVLSTFVYLYRRPASCQVSLEGAGVYRLPLPSIPQSLAPAAWAFTLLSMPAMVGTMLGNDHDSSALGPFPFLVGIVVLLPLLSLAAVHLFSTRKRVEANLPEVSLPEDFRTELNKRLYKTTAILTALAVGMTALGIYTHWSTLLDVVQVATIAAVGTDLFEEWQFRRQHPVVERLVELDNVQLALWLKVVFQKHGIACVVQAVHFRSLFFFFGPLYKMTVLVPADRLEEARERLAGLDVRIL